MKYPSVYSRRANSTLPPPPGAVYVGRPTPYGNPFAVTDYGTVRVVIEKYYEWIMLPEQAFLRAQMRRELKGKDLVCWCSDPGRPRPCHAYIILQISNKE